MFVNSPVVNSPVVRSHVVSPARQSGIPPTLPYDSTPFGKWAKVGRRWVKCAKNGARVRRKWAQMATALLRTYLGEDARRLVELMQSPMEPYSQGARERAVTSSDAHEPDDMSPTARLRSEPAEFGQ